MKQLRSGDHAISGVFVFLLLGLFAVFAVLTVALSAQLYRNTVTASELHNNQRVLTNYLAHTIHAGDQATEAGSTIRVDTIDGLPMLVISWPDVAEEEEEEAFEEADEDAYTGPNTAFIPEEGDELYEDEEPQDEDADSEEAWDDTDSGYETRIYCMNGQLYELLMTTGGTFCPEDGQVICPAAAFTPAISGGMLTIAFTDADGLDGVMHIRLYCAGEEVSE